MSGDEPRPSSRPATPESPYTSTHNLDHATSTIDDLTLALANFSRVPSPEPPSLLTCCCGENDCENMASWLNMKSRLESRLILSAEVGQALLQRHETYVRRQGKRRQRSEPLEYDDVQAIQENLERRIHELQRERDALEKRLTQALVNNEVTEVSSNTILQELHEAKTTVTRLTAHHAKSIGWEARMSAALKERDDMQQERDFESHRARLAESRFAALKDKTSRLQADVRRLHDDLQDKRMHRLESSESILQDARSQLQVLQRSLSPSVASEQTELTKVLESLMEDNEVLKRDSAELQHFLAESREEILALQEEVEEHRANAPRSSAGTPRTPTYQHHFHSGSMTSSILREHMSGRSSSTERNNRRPYDLLTPESHVRPLSPADSDSRWTSFSHPQPAHTSTPYNINVVDPDDDDATSEFERPRSHKPLLLLSRSRGIQTDPLPIERDRNPMFSSSPLDPRSDSSSYSESTSNMAQLIERVALLLNRISQADALTLTNRLKRQHLHGADVGHLSRTTVNNIITEASNLRLHFRALLEDDKMVTTCNRRDLRTLFKLFRDMFTELGQMRVTLNEVVLDPSVAPKVREWAMDPAKAEADAAKARNTGGGDNVAGWMAPISKLFGATGARPEAVASGERGAAALTRSLSGKGPTRPPRFVPKLSPALSASATTVNVEFSGSGVGRAVTSTASPHPSRPGLSAQQSSTTGQSVMGIFAGAPRSSTPDPWVVLPKEPRRVQSTILNVASPPTPRRTHTMSAQRMSRNVDAIVDVENSALSRVDQDSEEPDYLGPLREHTLKRRGLSDSSIHSTFMSQAEPNESVGSPSRAPDSRWPSRGSVLQALSRKVQNFRLGPPVVVSGSSSDNDGVSPGGSSVAASEGKEQSSGQSHQTFGNFIAIPGLSHWAGNEPSYIGSELFGSSPPTLRDEPSLMERRREDFY